MSTSATDGDADFDDEDVLATERGDSMWRLYAEYGRTNWWRGAIGVLGTVVARILGLVPAFILGLALDAVVYDRRAYGLPFVPIDWIPATQTGQLWLSVGLIVGSTVIAAGSTWVQNWGWNAFAQRVQHALRVDTYDAMQSLEMGFFDDRQTGQLLSVLSNDVNQLESFLSDGINSALRIGVMVLGIGVIMASLNPQLALVALLPIPVLAVVTYFFVTTIRPKYATMRESVGELNARLENNLGGMSVIKTENAEAYESNRVTESSQGYFDANWDAITTRIRFFPGLRIISGLGFALTFAVGTFWVLTGPPPGFSGTLAPGEFVTFIIYTQQFIWPIAQFGQIINMYQRAKASSERVYGLMTETQRLEATTDAPTLEVTEGDVDFDDVSFGYDDEELVLEDIDLSVSGGETVGLVGPTGAGKSTLLKLLIRMHDPDEGPVQIDGQEIGAVDVQSLRQQIGYVSQDPFLFYGTVRDNIAYGTFDTTDEEVIEAAKAAQAHEFIRNLPDGYETTVGERGVKLSGGQRQRVALARTILKDPAILLLDEATSHVDTETEALIQRSLAEFTAEKTTFAIAHRLSTIKDADEIVVLEDGRVEERGTHDELLANEGLYANFWRVQAGDVDSLPRDFLERALERRSRVSEANP